MRRLTFRLLCAAGLAAFGATANAAESVYEFGVLPYLPPAKVQVLYAPIAADFEAKLGHQVWLSSKTDYAQYRAALVKETYDIAFVQPFDYVDAHDRHGYLPLARRQGNLEGMIVVRADSPLKTIKDLRGRTVANPPADAVVSHLTSMALRDAGIDPATGVKRDYGKNQFTCMQSVLIGAADACGTTWQVVMHFEEEKQMKTRFRVLHRTRPSPPALFVVHRRVPKKDREVLLKTILEWPDNEEGRRILNAGYFVPFTPAQDSDYDSVRRYLRAAAELQPR